MKRERLIREFRTLSSLGLHLYPVGSDKLPIGQWALGEVNWVLTKADDDQGQAWADDPRMEGWAVLCGNKFVAVFTLDVESAGMGYPEIRAVLASLPATSQRPSPSGGQHAVIIVTHGEPVPTQALARVEGVLLAEVRGVSKGAANGAYAVITGPGRGPLSVDFEPARLTRAEADDLLDIIRELHRPSERESRTQVNKSRSAYISAGESKGSGTGRVIADGVLRGELSWLQVLEDGWTCVSECATQGIARIGLLRPSLGGPPPTSWESANAVGATLVVHSSAVEWAQPGEAFNPQQALAASRFDGDYAAAMNAVEAASAAYVTGVGRVPTWICRWPANLLSQIHAERQRSLRAWHAQRRGAPS